MTRCEELERLRDGVRDGTADKAFFDATWPYSHSFEHHHALQASIGNINSAITLFEAVLPGWWAELRYSTRPRAIIGEIEALAEAQSDLLSCALLLATLEALIAKEGQP